MNNIICCVEFAQQQHLQCLSQQWKLVVNHVSFWKLHWICITVYMSQQLQNSKMSALSQFWETNRFLHANSPIGLVWISHSTSVEKFQHVEPNEAIQLDRYIAHSLRAISRVRSLWSQLGGCPSCQTVASLQKATNAWKSIEESRTSHIRWELTTRLVVDWPQASLANSFALSVVKNRCLSVSIVRF